MKHTTSVTIAVLAVFFVAQIIGLFIVNSYIDKTALEQGKIEFEQLPLNVQRPVMEEQTSFVYIITAIIIGTLLVFVLIRFRQQLLWKLWFLLAVFITLNVAFKSFLPGIIATIAAALFAAWKIFRPNFYVHNFTEFFIYGGLAAIFVPILNVFSIIMLLLFISAYDVYAVWKSKHMVELAKFQTKANMFAGVIIPYKLPAMKAPSKKVKMKKQKIRTAILGGGDIGFPLLFAGVMLKGLLLTNSVSVAFAKVLIVPVFSTLALAWLLYKAEKDKFYPAMPVISAGCLLAFVLMHLIGFL